VAHANARTTVYARKLIVARVLAGHRPGEVAKQLGVSRRMVHKWVRRWRAEGAAGLADRSSRPHRIPRKTSPETTAAIVAARREHHAGPVRLAVILGIAASTIGTVLSRAGLPRLTEVDRLPVSCCAAAGTARFATNASTPAILSTSTSRSSAASPTAAAGAPRPQRAGPRARHRLGLRARRHRRAHPAGLRRGAVWGETTGPPRLVGPGSCFVQSHPRLKGAGTAGDLDRHLHRLRLSDRHPCPSADLTKHY
jgi:transposase